MRTITRFDLFKQTEIDAAAHLIIDLANMFPNDPKSLEAHLRGEVTKEELHQINDAALREGQNPIVFIPQVISKGVRKAVEKAIHDTDASI